MPETLDFVDKTQPKGRAIIKIVVTDDAKKVVEQIAARYGMKEYTVASAVYQWFGQQDDIFQRAVLGMLEGLEVDAARAFMERLAANTPKVVDVVVVGTPGSKADANRPAPEQEQAAKKKPAKPR